MIFIQWLSSHMGLSKIPPVDLQSTVPECETDSMFQEIGPGHSLPSRACG